eukprot:scaffold1725_cov46-Tisochrysis_lutea.AAC.1
MSRSMWPMRTNSISAHPCVMQPKKNLPRASSPDCSPRCAAATPRAAQPRMSSTGGSAGF